MQFTDAPRQAVANRVLVLAPLGRNASLLCRLLNESEISAIECVDMDELAEQMSGGAGAILLTEETLCEQAASLLTQAIESQPSWSDIPVVLLASGARFLTDSTSRVSRLRLRINLTLLERPVQALALVTTIQAALRARRRQYEVRDLVEGERIARQAADAACAEAKAANRTKDEFLATVSHELRTPLAAIVLWSKLLTSGRLPEDDLEKGLLTIERAAESQSRLIEDLLDMSRMVSGRFRLNMRPTELAPAVQSAVNLVLPLAAGKAIVLDASIDASAGIVAADTDRVQQIVANLLSNAVKFTPAGGHVSVRLARADNHAQIQITDTGKGISKEFLPLIFGRFQQADMTMSRREGGLGLGLAIVHQLVELHQGSVRAESAGKDQGATFTVRLPLTRVEAND
jgi:signal transduction histidine kinase